MLAGALMVLASFLYGVIPALNFYARGWEYPLILTGLMRLGFAAGTLVLLTLLYRQLFSRRGMLVTARAMRSEWKLLGLAMLTTGDVALFSLSYTFMDISVSAAMIAMSPTANVILLAWLNRGWLSGRQAIGLAMSVLGTLLMMRAGGTAVLVSGEWWRIAMGLGLGLGMVVCNGLTVSALRLGEVLAVEWYWEGLGKGAGLVWCGSMLTLAMAQGITVPLFLFLAASEGMPSHSALVLMFLKGLLVLLATGMWALANGSGLRPFLNGLGNLQPGWAVMILAFAGIASEVFWPALVAGLILVVGTSVVIQLWGGQDW